MAEHIRPRTTADTEREFVRGFGGELFDVTSMSRLDPTWQYVDAAGHVHCWYVDGVPATSYTPLKQYTLPTLVQVTDVEATDEYPGVSHYECRACRDKEMSDGSTL